MCIANTCGILNASFFNNCGMLNAYVYSINVVCKMSGMLHKIAC